MSTQSLKRGTAVIWTSREGNLGPAKVVLGIVQSPVDSDQVTIEIVEPDNDETRLVTVPADQVRNL